MFDLLDGSRRSSTLPRPQWIPEANLNEPLPIALSLATLGVLLAICVLFARFAGRVGAPLALAFLCIGMLAGSDGIGGIHFEDYTLAFRLGTVALVIILFDGGLNTRMASVREVLLPASLLATLGVVITAAVMAFGAHLIGLPWEVGCLLGAVVSSTDAAAVFSILRGSGVGIRRRVAATIEAESGLNDPMAVILTVTVTSHLQGGFSGASAIVIDVLQQLIVGAACGVGIGYAGRWLLRNVSLPAAGLVPALALAIALVAFGIPTIADGSGFLSVYLAAMILGNGHVPYRAGVLRVFDAGAWFAQISMFLMLGLLVFPTRLAEVAPMGLLLAAILVLLARPIAVILCLLPFRFPRRDMGFISWVGLRGAVPIVLATMPVLAGVPEGQRVFDLVFFIVVIGALVQGATVRLAAQRFRVLTSTRPAPAAVLEMSSLKHFNEEILSFPVTPASVVHGAALRDIPFPEGSAAMLIVRGEELIAPRGDTVLQAGDHIHIFLHPEDRPLVQLLFGRPEDA